MNNKNILLIISGGIAAYKSLELIRLIKKSGGFVRCILTKGGQQFVTPLSVESLSENPVHTNLWEPMDHINLSREADLVVVAPATADIMAKMAHGLADDLASTTLLAANKPIMIAPAMNPEMWQHPATQANLATLAARNIQIIDPATGEMACNETGKGRMPEATELFAEIERFFRPKPLTGKTAIVTAGPTYEPIDPVRFIGNRSSGKQGYAIAEALRDAGASVTLISGPSSLPTPRGITTVPVETAQDMLSATLELLPADIAICTAAVSDWTPATPSTQKIKKADNSEPPTLQLTENPDILRTISTHQNRPTLVIGFAAETSDLICNAKKKIKSKNCDWIIANDVSGNDVFGADDNKVHLITQTTQEDWPKASKHIIAQKLITKIIEETT